MSIANLGQGNEDCPFGHCRHSAPDTAVLIGASYFAIHRGAMLQSEGIHSISQNDNSPGRGQVSRLSKTDSHGLHLIGGLQIMIQSEIKKMATGDAGRSYPVQLNPLFWRRTAKNLAFSIARSRKPPRVCSDDRIPFPCSSSIREFPSMHRPERIPDR
jgi:hypothetical protein